MSESNFPASAELQKRFEGLLVKIQTEFPGNEQAQQISVQICHRLQQEFENPLHEQLELVLRDRFTPDRARHILFFPEPKDVCLYPLCIADPPEGAPKDHPQRKVQAAFLAVMYLHHIKEDKAFITEFVQHDGILALAQMVAHPNLYVRGQVVECMTSITSNSVLNWFGDAEEQDAKASKRYHPYLLALSKTRFVKDLVQNLEKSFPGGSFLCLQLLGFWLSWIRLFYCEDQILRVSPEIIEALRLHTLRTENPKEEVELARNMFEDFSRFPIASSLNGGDTQIAQEKVENKDEAASDAKEDPSSEVAAKVSSIAIESCSTKEQEDTVTQYHSAAKKHVDQGRFELAIENYIQALLQEPENPQTLSNLATMYWKKATRDGPSLLSGDRGDSPSECELRVVEDLERCVEYCEKALLVNPSMIKASYRLAKAKEALGAAENAYEIIKNALSRSFQKSEPSYSISERYLKELENKIKNQGSPLVEGSIDLQEDSSVKHQDMIDEENLIIQSILKRANIDHESVTNETVTISEKPKVENETDTIVSAITEQNSAGKQQASNSAMHGKSTFSNTLGLKRYSCLERLLKESPLEAAESLVVLGEKEQFRKLFKESLSDDVLCSILNSIDKYLLPLRWEEALNVLDNLTGVNRFQTILMFFSKDQLKIVQYIFQIIHSASKSGSDPSVLEKVLLTAKTYGVKL